MVDACRRIVAHALFSRVVLGLIVLNAAVMGLETWDAVTARWGRPLAVTNGAIQALFVVELALRIAAHGRRPLAFFRSGWNFFDFAVVGLSLLPAAGPFATLARLARVLRVGRLVSGLPDLRLIIGTMVRSIPAMGHIVMLLAILVYVYGVVGHHLFGDVDPAHWGSLGRAAHTLFVVITLEGWVEIMRTSTQATPFAWVYYASFIVIAVFVVTNLFIAVVINNLEKARKDDDALAPNDVADEVRRLATRIDGLEQFLRRRHMSS